MSPGWIDQKTLYRHFDNRTIEPARAIAYMRELAFPLAEIKETLDRFDEEADILNPKKYLAEIQIMISKPHEVNHEKS